MIISGIINANQVESVNKPSRDGETRDYVTIMLWIAELSNTYNKRATCEGSLVLDPEKVTEHVGPHQAL